MQTRQQNKIREVNHEAESLASFKKHLYVWRSFWLVLFSVTIYYLISISVPTDFKYFTNFRFETAHLLIGISFLLCIGLFLFLFNPGTQLVKQEIHKQPSWVFYLYWAFINGFLIWVAVNFFTENREEWWGGFWWFGLIPSLTILLLKFLNEILGRKPDLSFRDFASGSAGLEHDKLDFVTSAKNAAEGLKKLTGYVNVVGIYGGLGFGKSSYARMIIESFEPHNTLYTYISLTETNEARDFSKLFAERWLQTLKARYPKFDITSYLPFMYSILRESGNGILSETLKVLSSIGIDRGLIETKVAAYDEHFSKNMPTFTSVTVSKIFGNIPQIQESVWIIMVDEIERAQIDEVYRLVEIVERFRSEGRSGLPVKLLFIFCISEPEFGDYLKTFVDKDLRVSPLQTFFYESKSVSRHIFLPPLEPNTKYKFIDEQIFKVVEREEIQEAPKEDIYPNTFSNPTFKFMDNKEAMGYLYGVLGQQSLRMIVRTVTALDFFYGAFRDRSGGLQKNTIRLSDVVALEFIKIRYPFLMDFFLKTIHYLIAQTEQNNMGGYFLKKDLEEKKIGLPEWIERETNRKLTDIEKKDVLDLIGLVMHYYFDFLARDYNVKTKDKYAGTTSYPEVMHDYLSLVSDSIETNYRKYSQLFQKHKASTDDKLVEKLENGDLIGYARFLYDLYEAPQDFHVEIINELSRRLVEKEIKQSPMRVEDTPFDEAIYQFIFQIVSLTEKDQLKEEPSEQMKSAFEALKKVLTAVKLPVGAKLLVLNSLANNRRGGVSDVHARLESAFQKLSKYYIDEIKTLATKIFNEFDQRYLDGHDVLYDNEENFFFTMYQSWSGSKDANEEIAKIRKAAERSLERYPEALKLYWNQYPIKDGWRDLDDVYRDDVFFPRSENTGTLYMPLETLVRITNEAKIEDKELKAKAAFWGKLLNEARLQEQFVLKDDSNTLKSVLTQRNILT